MVKVSGMPPVLGIVADELVLKTHQKQAIGAVPRNKTFLNR